MINEDDIGNKTIGDTHTHVDFPYKCKHCGIYIRLEDRFKHREICQGKGTFWQNIFAPRGIEVTRIPIRETYAKGYKHTIINQNFFNRFVIWIKGLFK